MPLITTTDELKQYIAIDVNTQFESLSPFVADAEQLFLLPVLGQDFYDAVLALYDAASNDVSAMSDPEKSLMPYIQRSLANYAGYLSIAQMGASLGDIGIQEMHGEDSAPAPMWKVNKLEMDYLNKADLFAEKLLEYLEANASATVFADWFSSDKNTKNEGYMVNDVATASQYIDINNSRRLFLRLKKRIIDIEKGSIKRLVCEDQYAELVDQIQNDTITAENQALIDKLRPIIAKRALYLTLPSIRVAITDQGIHVYSSNDGIVQKSLASKDEVKWLMASLRDEEFGYLSDEDTARQFIYDNIADYPLIEASSCYTAKAAPGPKRPPVNLLENKHFSV